MDIFDSILRSPSKSLRKLAQEKDVGRPTARKAVWEKLNLFPYEITAVQELKQADHEKLIRYCEWFTNCIQTRTIDILDVIFFADEAYFNLSGYVTFWRGKTEIMQHDENIQCGYLLNKYEYPHWIFSTCCIISGFYSSKCCLFHNSTLFGSCIIHILNTGCAKI
jgi:hypothetical protein